MNPCSTSARLVAASLVVLILWSTPASVAANDGPSTKGLAAGPTWELLSRPQPLLDAGLRLAAEVEAQRQPRRAAALPCALSIPTGTLLGAALGGTVALLWALIDLGTPPGTRTTVLVTAGAALGAGVGIAKCTP
jgi:hypothetical protein